MRRHHFNSVSRQVRAAFTLIELLAVITIIGILAALVAPTLLHWRKGDAMLSASRLMLDGVARGRQLAISQHTTVYMVFVPPNFWNTSGTFNNAWFNALTLNQQTAASNVCDRQLTGFAFISLRSIGDQPGRNTSRYLSEWIPLPEKAFIAYDKFVPPVNYSVGGFLVTGFSYTNNFPFPTEDSPVTANNPYLPFIAFDYQGRVSTNGVDFGAGDAFIPLAQGSVAPATDANKRPVFAPPSIQEQPPGNSTSSSYNVIHVDSFTGRARLEHQQVK